MFKYHFATNVIIYCFTKYLSQIKFDSYCNVLSWFWGVFELVLESFGPLEFMFDHT